MDRRQYMLLQCKVLNVKFASNNTVLIKYFNYWFKKIHKNLGICRTRCELSIIKTFVHNKFKNNSVNKNR